MSHLPFVPQIWQSPEGMTMLVCGHRHYRGKPIPPPMGCTDPDRTGHHEFISFPVAISLEPTEIIFGFIDRSPDRIWNIIVADPNTQRFLEPFDHLSRQCAVLALEQAFRCVGSLEIDSLTMGATVKLDAKAALNFRGKPTIARNVFIWMNWGKWGHAKMNEAARLRAISAAGFQCTAKAFKRLTEDAGMSV